MPYVLLNENAMQEVIARPPPMWLDHSPSSICDDLPDTNALMPKRRRTLVRISVRWGARNDHGSLPFALWHWLRLGFRLRCCRGRASFGAGGVAGSFVGDSGSSSGMTVYLLIGSPILTHGSHSLYTTLPIPASRSPSSTGI